MRTEGLAMAYKPVWEGVRKELHLNGTLLKRFRQPAVNQQCMLDSFQELDWPFRIDDPLPGGDNVDARDRLHDTVRRLNDHRGRAIHFECDGTGKGVLWSLRKKKRKRNRKR